jgi:hypothetical protein
METAIIAAVIAGSVALTVGLIGAFTNLFTTLRAKGLDLAGQGVHRRAEILQKGYDQMLAALDSAWHVHCHSELSNLGIEPPFDWEAKWPAMRDEINDALSSAVDILKAKSPNYNNGVSTAILWAYRVAWEGYTLKMQRSMPEDYAEVRDMIVYCSRIDEQLDKPTGKRFWKQVSKNNQPRPPESGEEKLSRMQAKFREAINQGHKDVVLINQDQDAFVAYIESFSTHPPIYLASLEHSWRRMKSGANKGYLSSANIPCLTLDPPCHEAANKRLENLRKGKQ